MSIHDRWEVYGAGGHTVWDCQWPGCHNLAAHRTRRGQRMRYMRVCYRHMLAMRDLTDVDAFAVNDARQLLRSHSAAGRFVQRSQEDPFPGGGAAA